MDTKTTTISVTATAAQKVHELVRHEPNSDNQHLRLEVQPGGCAGFRYGLFFDDEIGDADVVEETSGVKIVVDKMSAPYLRGAVIDWKESLAQSGFVIENPNAAGRCACGDSFH